MLRGTFEEYIVGRLMEKLQMASHAIGDIEALLEASGIGGEDENGATSFDEKIRQLVIAALAGKDVEAATRQAEQSIDEAKSEAGARGSEHQRDARRHGWSGVCRTSRPNAARRRAIHGAARFHAGGLQEPWVRASRRKPPDLYLVEENGGREYIRFEENAGAGARSTLYAPGTAAFLRLVGRVIATGIHEVEDLDQNPAKESEEIARQWVLSFGGTPKAVEVEEVRRCFEGNGPRPRARHGGA